MGTLYGLAKIGESGVAIARDVQAMRERSRFKDYTAENPDWVSDPDKAARAAAISPELAATLGMKAETVRKMRSARARSNLATEIEDDDAALAVYEREMRGSDDPAAPINAANYGAAEREANAEWQRRRALRAQQMGDEWVERHMPGLWVFDNPQSERGGYAQRAQLRYAAADAIAAAEAADAEGGGEAETYNVYGADGTEIGGALDRQAAMRLQQRNPGASVIKTPSALQDGGKWGVEKIEGKGTFWVNPRSKKMERIAGPDAEVMQIDGVPWVVSKDANGTPSLTRAAGFEERPVYSTEKIGGNVVAVNSRNPNEKIVLGPADHQIEMRERKDGSWWAYDFDENRGWEAFAAPTPEAEKLTLKERIEKSKAYGDDYYKESKPFVDKAIALANLQALAEAGDAMSQIAIIYQWMKLNDPGSTVREGEYATAENAGGIADSMRNLYNSAVDGRFLQPEQVNQILRNAHALYAEEQKAQDARAANYRKIAERNGLSVEDILDRVPMRSFAAPSAMTPRDKKDEGGRPSAAPKGAAGEFKASSGKTFTITAPPPKTKATF